MDEQIPAELEAFVKSRKMVSEKIYVDAAEVTRLGGFLSDDHPLEADAAAGHLSLASPLGKALLGRAVGDRLQVQTPRGLRLYQVLEIHREQV